jgi:hypothetical protein
MLKRLLEIAKRERARCSAMLLLVCLFLPLAQTAIASTQDPEASLPACCRSHGKHKCFMRAVQERSDQQNSPAFRTQATLSEKCPCLPASSVSTFHSASEPAAFRALHLALAGAEPSLFVRSIVFQSNSHSANQKRGPPSIFAKS